MFKSKKVAEPQSAAKPQPEVAPAAPKPERAPEPALQNFISAGTIIEGNIISHEDLRMEGKVKGDIKTSARLWLGSESVVEGNILASEADVAGRITGTVESKGLLAIKSTCRIEGDIITKSLHVESGSSFNGRCKVGGDPEPEAARSVVANRLKQASAASAAPKSAATSSN